MGCGVPACREERGRSLWRVLLLTVVWARGVRSGNTNWSPPRVHHRSPARHLSPPCSGCTQRVKKLNRPSWEPKRRTWRVEPRCGQKAHMETKSTARGGHRSKSQTTHMGIGDARGVLGRPRWRLRQRTRRVCVLRRRTQEQPAQLLSFPLVGSVARCGSHRCEASHDVDMCCDERHRKSFFVEFLDILVNGMNHLIDFCSRRWSRSSDHPGQDLQLTKSTTLNVYIPQCQGLFWRIRFVSGLVQKGHGGTIPNVLRNEFVVWCRARKPV